MWVIHSKGQITTNGAKNTGATEDLSIRDQQRNAKAGPDNDVLMSGSAQFDRTVIEIQ